MLSEHIFAHFLIPLPIPAKPGESAKLTNQALARLLITLPIAAEIA